MKRPIDKAALEDSFENLVRNLDSYFATVDNTEYGLLMTQVSTYFFGYHPSSISQLKSFFLHDYG